MRFPRINHCLVSFKGIYAFAIGSKDDRGCRRCEVYNKFTGQWKEISPLKHSRYSATGCIVQNRFLYVIGGYKGNGSWAKSIEIYDIFTSEIDAQW
jgi:hypothetical protein